MTATTRHHDARRGTGVPGYRRYPTPLSLARPAISNKNRTYLVRGFSHRMDRIEKSENATRRGTDRYPGTPEAGGIR